MELENGTDRPLEGRPTRGFLFSDLRGYTAFLDSNGADAATELLGRYRRVVREAIARHSGAEIRTEGDGFYVVFPSVSSAVTCGSAILDGVARETSGPPIAVGIGVNAGEAVETSDGYVSSAVNVAARLCAIAGPGEMLVSDTVRALTRSVLDVTFVSKGRRNLKGVSEPVLVFAVRPAMGPHPNAVGQRSHRRVVAMVGLAIVVAAGLGGMVLLLGGREATPSPTASVGAAAPSPPPTARSTSSAAASHSPSPAPKMDGPQQDLLAHVPAQFKAGCVPGPLLGVKAQIVCTGPPGIPIIVYTAYDSAATMDETFRSDTFGGISSCTGGRYERSYYQSTEKQSGRVICDVDANIPRIDWTDDRLAIIVTAKSTDLESGGELSLEGLHRWWEKREAGPIP